MPTDANAQGVPSVPFFHAPTAEFDSVRFRWQSMLTVVGSDGTISEVRAVPDPSPWYPMEPEYYQTPTPLTPYPPIAGVVVPPPSSVIPPSPSTRMFLGRHTATVPISTYSIGMAF